MHVLVPLDLPLALPSFEDLCRRVDWKDLGKRLTLGELEDLPADLVTATTMAYDTDDTQSPTLNMGPADSSFLLLPLRLATINTPRSVPRSVVTAPTLAATWTATHSTLSARWAVPPPTAVNDASVLAVLHEGAVVGCLMESGPTARPVGGEHEIATSDVGAEKVRGIVCWAVVSSTLMLLCFQRL